MPLCEGGVRKSVGTELTENPDKVKKNQSYYGRSIIKRSNCVGNVAYSIQCGLEGLYENCMGSWI